MTQAEFIAVERTKLDIIYRAEDLEDLAKRLRQRKDAMHADEAAEIARRVREHLAEMRP